MAAQDMLGIQEVF